MPNTLQQTYSDLPQMEYKMKDPVAVGATNREVTCRLCKLAGKEQTQETPGGRMLGGVEDKENSPGQLLL